MFYGTIVWDPWLIVAQIVCIQCLYYLSLGVFMGLLVATRVNKMSLVYFFDFATVTLSTVTGWCVVVSFLLSSVAGAGFLLYLIERAKRCLDFSATIYIIHLCICILYGGWPSSVTWWVVNGTGLAITALLGEYLCIQREMRDIPISRLRPSNSNPTRFTLEMHHGGFFTMGSGRRYMNGKVNWFDAVDIDEFSVIELKDMLRRLGYKEEDTMYFHFRMPNKDLDTGLHPLANDSDVLHLAKFLGKNKVIEVYMELWLSSIDIFQQSTNKPKVTFDVPQQSKNIEHDEDVVMNSQPWANEFDMSNDFDPFFEKENSSSGDVRGQCIGKNVDVDEVSDLMEDDENPVNDVEVDMDYFRQSLEQNVEQVDGSEQEIIELDLEEFWRKSGCPLILTPPDYHTPIGRPPKKRKKSAYELSEKMVKNGKLSRAGKTVTCKICNQLGHNQRTCKQKTTAEAATTNRKKSKAAGNKGAQRKNKGT